MLESHALHCAFTVAFVLFNILFLSRQNDIDGVSDCACVMDANLRSDTHESCMLRFLRNSMN